MRGTVEQFTIRMANRNNESIRTHALVVLEYLENSGILVPVGHGKKFKSWTQRLFRTVDVYSLQYHNYGAVFVHVDNADGLIADNMSGTSNPSAEVRLGDTKISTPIIRRDLNPVWKSTFIFFVRFEMSVDADRSGLAAVKRPVLNSRGSERGGYQVEAPRLESTLSSVSMNAPEEKLLEAREMVALGRGQGGTVTNGNAGMHSQSPNLQPTKRSELELSIEVYAHRSPRGRMGIGRTSSIPLRTVRAQRKSLADICSVQGMTLSLFRKRVKDKNVLLAARTGFKQGKTAMDSVEDGISRSAKAAAKRVIQRSQSSNDGGTSGGNGDAGLGDLSDLDNDEDDSSEFDSEEEFRPPDMEGPPPRLERSNTCTSTSSAPKNAYDFSDSEESALLRALQLSEPYSDQEYDHHFGGAKGNNSNLQMSPASRPMSVSRNGQDCTKSPAHQNQQQNGGQHYTNSKLGQLEVRLAWVQLVPDAASGAFSPSPLCPPRSASGSISDLTELHLPPPNITMVDQQNEESIPLVSANNTHSVTPGLAAAAAASAAANIATTTTTANSNAKSKPGHTSLPRPRLFQKRDSSRMPGQPALEDSAQSSSTVSETTDRPKSLKRQTSKLNRILTLRSKKPQATSVVLGDMQGGDASELARSRKVQYREQRRQALMCHVERRAAIEAALEDFKKSSHKTTKRRSSISSLQDIGNGVRTSKEISEDAEAELAVRCFLFEYPVEAFKLLAGEDQQIVRAMWITLAPLLPPLCHALNAHQVFDALLLAQFGNKLNRKLAMSSQVRALGFPVFEIYVRSLKASSLSLEKAKRKAVADFPALQRYLADGEKLVCMMDKVRGGRSQETAYRRSQYGGRLFVTTRAVYFAKKHTFHSNELVREDLWNAVQVLESNGSVDFGLMIGFSNKVNREENIINMSGSTSPSMLPGFLPSKGGYSGDQHQHAENPRAPSPSPSPSPSPYLGPSQVGAFQNEETGELRTDMPNIDDLISRLAADRLLDDEDYEFEDFDDEENDSEPPDGPGFLSRASSAPENSSHGASRSEDESPNLKEGKTPSPGRFEIVLPRKTIARYVVYRFPAYGTWRRRDVDILKLRALIAVRIFVEHVLSVVLEKYIVKIETVGSGVEISKPTMLAASREAAGEVALADLQSFKALVRMSEKRDWEWLDGVDTFEAFGDKWSWKRWSPLAFNNLVCSAVQPHTKRSENLRARANESLFTLAIELLKQVASAKQYSITWSRGFTKAVNKKDEISNSSLGSAPPPTTASSAHASRTPPQARTLQSSISEDTLYDALDDDDAATNASATSTASVEANSDLLKAGYRPDLASSVGSLNSLNWNEVASHGSLYSARTSPALLESVDKWWLEQTKQLQSDIVRSATRLKSLSQNIDLFMNVLLPIKNVAHDTKEIYHAVITWESPGFTIGLGIVSFVLIVLGYTAHLCGILIAAVALYLLHMRHVRDNEGFRKLYVPPRQKKTLLEKYRGIKEKYQVAKKVLQRINLVLLRIRSVLTWENERVSTHVTCWFIALAMILIITPRMVYELAVWVYIFTKKFRSGRFRRRVIAYLTELWNEVPPAPLWEKIEQHQS